MESCTKVSDRRNHRPQILQRSSNTDRLPKVCYHANFSEEANYLYLREIRIELLVKTGTTVSESAICRFLQHNFPRKKLHMVAKQRNEQLRMSFTSDCEIYAPEMMVFVDETGSNSRDSMRKFGYSLR